MILGFGLGTGACDEAAATVWETSSLLPGPPFLAGPGNVAVDVSFGGPLATAPLAFRESRWKGSCSQTEILLRFFLRLAVASFFIDGDGDGSGLPGG